jgi:PhnB protein
MYLSQIPSKDCRIYTALPVFQAITFAASHLNYHIMLTINAYFNFMGNTEEAMNFYKSVFGGEFTAFTRFKDLPGSENMPAHEREKIMHITLTTENGTNIMATDFLESMEQKFEPGNGLSLCIQAESEEEVDKLFKYLSNDGKVEMPLNKTFWGAYFGICKDKYGVNWMINFSYSQNQPQ